MIKQSKIEHGKDAKSPVIFAVYEEGHFCRKLSAALDYDYSEEIDKSYGEITVIPTAGKLPYSKLYVLGLGKIEDLSERKIMEAFGKVSKTIKEKEFTISLNQLVTDDYSAEKLAGLISEAVLCARYEFTKINGAVKEEVEVELIAETDISKAIAEAVIVAEAVNHARTLGNTPSNFMTPEILADYALQLAKQCNLEATVLDNKALEKMGAGALLGVNQGSAHEARLIMLKYNGADNEPYTALVGKGITFDSGGYNLKPSASMTGMKYDMCGGAAVLSALEIIAKKKIKANVYAIVPATENMISGEGYKCDDVLVSLSKKTIEITNTDAEGRLILCDAITYASQLGVTRIVDIATLTGACFVALGGVYTGAFSNSEDYYRELVIAAEKANEKVWRLPLDETYAKQLKASEVADIMNSAGRGGGASVAAEFLHEFVEDGIEWIHLDIAGSGSEKAATDLGPTGATGVMVKTLANLV